MNLVIIETFEHFDSLKTILSILCGIDEISEIYLFTTDNTLKKISLDLDDYKNKIKIKICNRKLSSLRRCFLSINYNRPIDFVIFNTIGGLRTLTYKNFMKYIKRNSKLILGIHNVFYIFPDLVDKEDYNIILDYTIQGYKEHYTFLKILPNTILKLMFKFFVGISSKNYYKLIDGVYTFGEYIAVPKNIPHISLITRSPDPEFINKRENTKFEIVNNREEITFVVPGAVVEGRRDYGLLLSAVQEVHKENFKLIFLGRIISHKIRRLIENHEKSNKFVYFDDFVDEETFKSYLMKAHYVLAPLKYCPPYGKYKTSGNIGDAIAHGVPLIIPETFAPQYEFGKNVLRYNPSRDGLKSIIEDAINYVEDGKYEEFFDEAINNAQKITVENISKKFEDFLMKIMKE